MCKRIRDYRLLFDCISRDLATAVEDIADQFSTNKINEMIENSKTIDDMYDMRRYVLCEDKEKNNLVLLTTGCYEDEYENGKNLPQIDDLIDFIEHDVGFSEILSVFQEKRKAILAVYQWFNEKPRCTLIEDEDLYDEIVDTDYFNMISAIENELI